MRTERKRSTGPSSACSVEDCSKPAPYGNAMCGMHRGRYYRHGDPHVVLQNHGLTKEERFAKYHVIGDPEECWEWQGYVAVHGYGQLHFAGKHLYAHRVSWETYMGPIPEGLTIDHLCFNKKCVNPNHLEPVTHLENVRRARHLQRASILANFRERTHCKHGHEYTPENTLLNKNGNPACRKCAIERGRKYRARRKGRLL